MKSKIATMAYSQLDILHYHAGNEADYPGTIVDCNHIYVDSDVYTDGNGNHDPPITGHYNVKNVIINYKL